MIVFCSLVLCKNVSAGTLSWVESKQISNNTFEFYLNAEDLELNYLTGSFDVTNGVITRVTPESGWRDISTSSDKFYFVRDTVAKGNFRIATITVQITGNSQYSIVDVEAGIQKCMSNQGLFFDPNGNIVNEQTYKQMCLSGDSTLKSLTISHGTLSPAFRSYIYNYSASVDFSVTEVDFTATVNGAGAKILSGQNCKLNVGKNICNVVVEAANGTQSTYIVEVTRASEPDPDLPPVVPSQTTNYDYIYNLIIHGGTLKEEFIYNVFHYTILVERNVEYIHFSYTIGGVFLEGEKIADGPGAIFRCDIKNTNVCVIEATDPSGKVNNTYHFNIEFIDNNEEDNGDKEPDDSNPGNPDDPNDKDDSDNSQLDGPVENPETGDWAKPGLFLISTIILIVTAVFMKKKNYFRKI